MIITIIYVNVKSSVFALKILNYGDVKLQKINYFCNRLNKKIMEYQKAIEVLYNQAPMFQHLGKRAYKSGLENTYILDERLGHPHKNYHTIHVAGTN